MIHRKKIEGSYIEPYSFNAMESIVKKYSDKNSKAKASEMFSGKLSGPTEKLIIELERRFGVTMSDSELVNIRNTRDLDMVIRRALKMKDNK